MINVALKRLRNDLIDFIYQVDQLKKSLIESKKLSNSDETHERVGLDNNSLKDRQIELKQVRINNVNY